MVLVQSMFVGRQCSHKAAVCRIHMMLEYFFMILWYRPTIPKVSYSESPMFKYALHTVLGLSLVLELGLGLGLVLG